MYGAQCCADHRFLSTSLCSRIRPPARKQTNQRRRNISSVKQPAILSSLRELVFTAEVAAKTDCSQEPFRNLSDALKVWKTLSETVSHSTWLQF